VNAATDELAAAVADSLARERALGRTYRQQMDTAWSPRVRRLWEEGWMIKRGHADALVRVLADHAAATSSEPPQPSLSAPSPREVLSWLYDQERLLVQRYREYARRAVDADAQRVFNRLADEQRRLIERVRETYRDYSAS
jgi:rubrerythrin